MSKLNDKVEVVMSLSKALRLARKNDVYWLWPLNLSDLEKVISRLKETY